MRFETVILAALAADYANAFYGTAHLFGKLVSPLILNAVAKRAQDILSETNPDALQSALNELATL